jgi:hypothetical protein
MQRDPPVAGGSSLNLEGPCDGDRKIVRPGISPDTLTRAGVKLSDSPEPGSIEIPYFDVVGQPIEFSRWRLRTIRPNGQKYHQMQNSGVHVYFPPGGINKSPQLVIVEGEFKALPIFELGMPVIGLCGLCAYKRDKEGNASPPGASAAHQGESDNCAVMLFRSLRKRGVNADQIISGFCQSTQSARDLMAARGYVVQGGKFQGKTVGELPMWYLRWAIKSRRDISFNLRRAIRLVLDARG